MRGLLGIFLLTGLPAQADSFDYIKCNAIFSLMEHRGKMLDQDAATHRAKWRNAQGSTGADKHDYEFAKILDNYKKDIKLMRKDYSKYNCP